MNARTLPDTGIQASAYLPPHSIEAEQAVLGGLLIAGAGALDRIEGVMTAADFYRDDHRRIFSAMKALGDSGKPVDAVMVAEALQNLGELESVGGLSYIVALASNTPSAANLHRYAEIVREVRPARPPRGRHEHGRGLHAPRPQGRRKNRLRGRICDGAVTRPPGWRTGAGS